MSTNAVNKTTGELVTLANGTRMWIGTKSAHDLAVQQGIMPNNCMVCITDDAAGEEAWEYSTSETNTGKKWIDGKPIYRKVIETAFDNALSTNDWYHATSVGDTPNVAQYTQIRAIINTSNNVIIDLNGVYILEHGAYYHFKSSYTTSGGLAKIILEYTKTTD